MLVQKLSGFKGVFFFFAAYMIRGRRARDYVHLFSNYTEEKYFSVEVANLTLSQETKKLSSWKISARGAF